MRSVLVCIAALGFAVLLGTASAALAQKDSDTPQKAVERALNSAIDVLKEPGYINPATRPPLRAKLEQIIRSVFDFSEFSARTVGQKWAGFTAEQKQSFNEAFAELLMATYIDKINGYSGEKVEFVGEKFSPKGDRAEVSTFVVTDAGKKIPVVYRLMPKTGQWVIYDVIVENVSLIKNYRSQFADILSKGSTDDLIARVHQRTQEVAKDAASKG